jgi:hypothetical protein
VKKVLQRQDLLQALVNYHFNNASLSIDMRGGHSDHYCIRCAPLICSKMSQERPVLSARPRTSLINFLIISVSSTCAERKAHLELGADEVSGRKIPFHVHISYIQRYLRGP